MGEKRKIPENGECKSENLEAGGGGGGGAGKGRQTSGTGPATRRPRSSFLSSSRNYTITSRQVNRCNRAGGYSNKDIISNCGETGVRLCLCRACGIRFILCRVAFCHVNGRAVGTDDQTGAPCPAGTWAGHAWCTVGVARFLPREIQQQQLNMCVCLLGCSRVCWTHAHTSLSLFLVGRVAGNELAMCCISFLSLRGRHGSCHPHTHVALCVIGIGQVANATFDLEMFQHFPRRNCDRRRRLDRGVNEL